MAQIETIHNANAYSDQQIEEMCAIYATLNRGVLEVYEPPEGNCGELGLRCEYCEHVNA